MLDLWNSPSSKSLTFAASAWLAFIKSRSSLRLAAAAAASSGDPELLHIPMVKERSQNFAKKGGFRTSETAV